MNLKLGTKTAIRQQQNNQTLTLKSYRVTSNILAFASRPYGRWYVLHPMDTTLTTVQSASFAGAKAHWWWALYIFPWPSSPPPLKKIDCSQLLSTRGFTTVCEVKSKQPAIRRGICFTPDTAVVNFALTEGYETNLFSRNIFPTTLVGTQNRKLSANVKMSLM